MEWKIYVKGGYNQGYLATIKMNNKHTVRSIREMRIKTPGNHDRKNVNVVSQQAPVREGASTDLNPSQKARK